MESTSASAMPLYLRVKAHVLERIASGELRAFARVPSENELVRELGVSRMTVNRALNELTGEGILVRTPGVGTFVAERPVHTHPLEIHNIADEIRGRGHKYKAVVLKKEAVSADIQLAAEFELPVKAQLFHSLVMHHENDAPIQLEDRYVNPAVAPRYLTIDFEEHTPNEYLMQVAPLQRAEHTLRAAMPKGNVAKLLHMQAGEPCLLLLRRTWTGGTVASCARLYYPGSRYEFVGRFAP